MTNLFVVKSKVGSHEDKYYVNQKFINILKDNVRSDLKFVCGPPKKEKLSYHLPNSDVVTVDVNIESNKATLRDLFQRPLSIIHAIKTVKCLQIKTLYLRDLSVFGLILHLCAKPERTILHRTTNMKQLHRAYFGFYGFYLLSPLRYLFKAVEVFVGRRSRLVISNGDLLKVSNEVIGTFYNKKALDRLSEVHFDKIDRVMYAGRFTVRKGASHVIKLAEMNPSMQFVVAGEVLIDQSQVILPKNLEFLGVLSDHECYTEIMKSKYYLSLSEADGISKSILEALSLNCEVIAIETGLLAHLTEDSNLISHAEMLSEYNYNFELLPRFNLSDIKMDISQSFKMVDDIFNEN
jgi:glycosyltransferase involved in cell wall biosynthesis